jgi:hypothetical protein
MFPRSVFLNRWAADQYQALTSIIPGPRLIEKKLPGRGLTKVENHCLRKLGYRDRLFRTHVNLSKAVEHWLCDIITEDITGFSRFVLLRNVVRNQP